MAHVVIGVDLGGTNVKTALVTEDRKLLAKDSRPTRAEEGPEAVMDVMAEAARDLLGRTGLRVSDVLAAGFGAPGPMNWQTGVVYSPPNLPGWKDVPLADEMARRLGVPCFVDNDANVACYGEFWMGAGRGHESIVVFTLGTGVGGGIVVFGRLLRGIDGTAAELGHLKVHRDGRLCGCGSRGCLEAYASVTGMVRTAREGWDTATTALKTMTGGDPDRLDGRLIYEAAAAGDAYARWVFEETATWLGLGCASMVNALNPERIVLCGGMIAAGDLLFDTVRRVTRANAFEVPGNRCIIVPAGLGEDAGVIGCAGCALARLRGEAS
ncbi:MAG TPA: ROK family glucokinase [Candidatus Hydrogenedentes bacterium]|nr:ROK family glucokinase [Candidatus Hydrogenedentota bacterium]